MLNHAKQRDKLTVALSGELDQLFDAKGVGYDKAKADQIREANK